MASSINDYIYEALSAWAANGTLNMDVTVIILTGIPASDPHVAGQLWNNSGVLSVSAG